MQIDEAKRIKMHKLGWNMRCDIFIKIKLKIVGKKIKYKNMSCLEGYSKYNMY